MVPIRRIKDHFYYKDLEKSKKTSEKASSSNSLTEIIFLLPPQALSLMAAFEDFSHKWNGGSPPPQIVVLSTEKTEPEAPPHTIYIIKKDVDWKGVIQNPKIQNVLNRNFDLLINMDSSGLRPLEHLSAAIPANLKIGLRETRHKIYDILVETDSKDMMHNLKSINQILQHLQS